MFSRLSIPTPFQVGPVNAYLAGRTLVDPGPDSEEAWSQLLEELEKRDLTPADVEQVLVTHPHPDHFGLARRFRDEGARVLASPASSRIIEDFAARLEYEQTFFVDCFERHGMARSTAKTVTELPEAYLQYAPDCDTDRLLEAGEEVTVDDEPIRMREAEGHAPGELVFEYDGAEGREAIVGDQVLPDITPNPLLQPPAEEGRERPRVLPAFNDSLDALREVGYDRLLPGHREIIDDPGGRIAEIRASHEERTENVRDLVDGKTTAMEVMEELFGDLPATELFPGMSEAIGHLDVLEARGEVTRSERGGVVVYERA
ncbi:MBL fold metallo-hydrolase [Halostella sp. JP-L12]|uniref:MBL fold metallo-hydrolase n=1 Tax=Halostella TaxID=1843185 RepID=UPI000EF78B4F|nr:MULTISPECIES: MBL fold metallo-hydrolase [Halostella]NHN48394.1 MBL fold metallo-hydrolase [Halostella sp. JP-L12]